MAEPCVVVAIPVKNEEARLHACLDSLARQNLPPAHIVLLLNNCTDGSAVIARRAAEANPRIEAIECDLPPEHASAGQARRLVLREAAARAGDGVIVTTDADCRFPEDWTAKILRDIGGGADVVCGMARLDGSCETLPRRLHFDLDREEMYASLIDEITALADPDPADPWPRHQHNSGASIAMLAGKLREIGGAPSVPFGEDRKLIEIFRRHDAKIRHAPDIFVTVSGRLEGRAVGGMAAALSRRAQRLDEVTDAALEPAVDAYRRALARARLRGLWQTGGDAAAAARDLLLAPEALAAALGTPKFGAAWAAVEDASPVLLRRRVPFAVLARETRHALALRDQLLLEAAGTKNAAAYSGGPHAG